MFRISIKTFKYILPVNQLQSFTIQKVQLTVLLISCFKSSTKYFTTSKFPNRQAFTNSFPPNFIPGIFNNILIIFKFPNSQANSKNVFDFNFKIQTKRFQLSKKPTLLSSSIMIFPQIHFSA